MNGGLPSDDHPIEAPGLRLAPPPPPTAAPSLPTLPTLPTRPGLADPTATAADRGHTAGPATTSFHELLTETRRVPVPAVRRRRSWGAWLFLAILLAAVGAGGWFLRQRQLDQREQTTIPTFTAEGPSTTSYWTFVGDALADDGTATRYRAQRAPGVQSIVLELEAGFADLDGETLLVTPEGTWFFDRLSGATTPTPLVGSDLFDGVDEPTRLVAFDDLVPDYVRADAEMVSRTDLARPQEGANGALTQYEIDIDLRRFDRRDHAAFVRWMEHLGIIGDADGGELDRRDIGDGEVRLDVVADEAGTVWNWQLIDEGLVVVEYRLLELSDGPFIPPDPTPDVAAEVAPEAAPPSAAPPAP